MVEEEWKSYRGREGRKDLEGEGGGGGRRRALDEGKEELKMWRLRNKRRGRSRQPRGWQRRRRSWMWGRY